MQVNAKFETLNTLARPLPPETFSGGPGRHPSTSCSCPVVCRQLFILVSFLSLILQTPLTTVLFLAQVCRDPAFCCICCFPKFPPAEVLDGILLSTPLPAQQINKERLKKFLCLQFLRPSGGFLRCCTHLCPVGSGDVAGQLFLSAFCSPFD